MSKSFAFKNTIPVAPLKICPLESCREFAEKVDRHIVTFRPDMNAARMAGTARRLEMPAYPEDKFVQAVVETVRANAAWVPPFGTGCSLYIRPVMIGSGPQIGVAPAPDFVFRVFVMPVGAYFKGAVKPLKICVSDYDRAAPRGTGGHTCRPYLTSSRRWSGG